jgi:KipI family sensor histidine kinase inhibitor
MRSATPEILRLGDSAILVRLDAQDEALASSLAESLATGGTPGVVDVSAAYHTVAIYFDPRVTDEETLGLTLTSQISAAASVPPPESPTHVVEVTYDGADLTEVAARTGLSRTEVVELHSAVEYRAGAVGFVPGFAYLDGLDERLRLPRRSAPRPRVPAGSVAIAGSQSAVYPFATPGGWHLIGRTDQTMFDPGRSPPALLCVGSRVRFQPR